MVLTSLNVKLRFRHPDARYFELEDQGEVVGGFFFDLYALTGNVVEHG